jgi:hypothetical protein
LPQRAGSAAIGSGWRRGHWGGRDQGDRKTAQAGSVTFLQRFGSAINAHLHFHVIFLEGVYVERADKRLKPRFVKVEPPTDADIAAIIHKISQRVIRPLRQLGVSGGGH